MINPQKLHLVLLLTLAAQSFAMSAAQAQEIRADEQPDSRNQTVTNGKTNAAPSYHPLVIEAGLDYYQFDYAEDLAPPFKSTEKGLTPGLHVAGIFQPIDTHPWHVAAIIDLATNRSDYDGSTLSGKPVLSKTSNMFFNIEFNTSYELIHFSPVSKIEGYVGLGYHFWRRGLGASDTGGTTTSDYTEDYSWSYVPVGVRLLNQLSNTFQIGIDFSVRPMFGGRIGVHYSDLKANLQDVDADLGSRVGFRAEVPLLAALTPEFGVLFKPWYQFSSIGQSNTFEVRKEDGEVIGVGYEPSSRTHQFGALISGRFSL